MFRALPHYVIKLGVGLDGVTKVRDGFTRINVAEMLAYAKKPPAINQQVLMAEKKSFVSERDRGNTPSWAHIKISPYEFEHRGGFSTMANRSG